jgi:hypothetical protein
MGSVAAPHRSPTAPRERDWDWDGTDKLDRIIRERGWDGVALAHAWHDPQEDPTTIHRRRRAPTSSRTTSSSTVSCAWSGAASWRP